MLEALGPGHRVLTALPQQDFGGGGGQAWTEAWTLALVLQSLKKPE